MYLVMAIVSLSGCGMAGLPFSGQVTDAETGEPIEGVIVVALWKGDVNPIVDSTQICYHVETAVSDENGKYRVPGWVGGKFGVMGSYIITESYKQGYERVPVNGRYSKNEVKMAIFTGTLESRMSYLVDFAGQVSCGPQENREKALFQLYKEIYLEARGLSNVHNYASAMDSILYRIVTTFQKSDYSMTRKDAVDYFERELEGRFND